MSPIPSMPAASNGSASGRRILVVGAGITGLATAHRLVTQNQDAHVTVLESSSRLGGIIQTVERDGFTIELGPDSFITNKPGGMQLCSELNFQDQLIPTDSRYRKSLVLSKGRPLPVPDGFMLMAPSSIWPILTTPVLTLRGKLRLLCEMFVPKSPTSEDESLASFVRRRFGPEALDRLVQPLVGGIYTSDPEKLSLAATMPRFLEMEQNFGSVIKATLKQRSSTGSADRSASESGSGARYGLFVAPRQGLSQLIRATADACLATRRVSIETEKRVLNVQQTLSTGPLKWQVQVDGEAVPREFDAVMMTLPAWMISKLLPGENFLALRQALDQIEYASSAIVVSTHRLEDFEHPLDAFGLVIPHRERRRILAVSFSSRKFVGRAPEGWIVLRTFVGGAMQPELFNQTDSELVSSVNRELTSILGMKKPPATTEIARYPRSMPQYHVGHLDRVKSIDREVAAFPGLAVCGSSFYGVGIPDSISSGRQEADRILQQLKICPPEKLQSADG